MRQGLQYYNVKVLCTRTQNNIPNATLNIRHGIMLTKFTKIKK